MARAQRCAKLTEEIVSHAGAGLGTICVSKTLDSYDVTLRFARSLKTQGFFCMVLYGGKGDRWQR